MYISEFVLRNSFAVVTLSTLASCTAVEFSFENDDLSLDAQIPITRSGGEDNWDGGRTYFQTEYDNNGNPVAGKDSNNQDYNILGVYLKP